MFMVTAHSYELKISEDEQITHVQDEWIYVGKSTKFDLFVEKGMLKNPKDETMDFHAYIEFNEPENIEPLKELIYRIYTYGQINCRAGQMMMISDLYATVENKIEFKQFFAPGVQIIDMTTPNTLRLEAYNLICKESI